MRTFDGLYFLDLHGNANKKERTPEGGKDENVFDIRQGVAVGIFVKESNKTSGTKVQHADMWGMRREKYERLITNGTEEAEQSELESGSPSYLFAPQNADLMAEYEHGWKLTEIMPSNGAGMTTARDHVVVDYEKSSLLERARIFRDSIASNEELCTQLEIPMKAGWDISRARQLLQAERDMAGCVKLVQHRPFDERFIFYHDSLVWRTVKKIMPHMTSANLGLITTRQTRDSWDAHATRSMITHKALAAYDISSLFPLYLYSTDNLFDVDQEEREPNLAPEFVEAMSEAVGLRFVSDGVGDLDETFDPEDVFHYAYAVFHSPAYRERYAEFLKRDFPRLPLTTDLALFRELCGWGEELVSLHLMRSPYLDDPSATFPKSGSNVMQKAKHDAEENRVYINKEGQYFDNVPEETWNFRVGGYQVLDKWLKDRKGRTLTDDDVEHYRKVVAALGETAQIMAAIDDVIEARGGWPLAGSVEKETGVEG